MNEIYHLYAPGMAVRMVEATEVGSNTLLIHQLHQEGFLQDDGRWIHGLKPISGSNFRHPLVDALAGQDEVEGYQSWLQGQNL